jgi:hypothetical protein
MGDLVTRVLSDERLRFPRDFATREVKMLTSVSPGARISEMDDSTTRILPQTDAQIFHLFMISDVECPDSRPPDPELPNVDIPIQPFGTFASAYARFKPRATLDRSNGCRVLA